MVSYISETIDVFKREESLLEKTLIGLGLFFLSFLIIPAFLYQGYLMKILDETDQGFPDQLPEWENYKELFIYGLIAFGFSLVALVPGYGLIFAPVVAGIESSAILLASIGGGILYLFTVGYLMPALYAIVIRDSSSGLSLGRLNSILFSKDYFIGWLIITGAGLVFGFISIIINLFTFGFGSIFLFPFAVPLNYATMLILGVAVTESEN